VPELPIPPQTLEQVTPEWLDSVLRHSSSIKECRVIDIRIEPVPGVAGFAAETVRIVPVYDEQEASAPASPIAKLATRRADLRDFMFERGLYRDETLYYSTVAPLCDVSSPFCYFVGYDSESKRVGLLMEDLSSSMVQGDELEDTPTEALISALEALAVLHASFWDGTHRHDLSALRSSSGLPPADPTERWHEFPEELRTLIPEAVVRLAGRLCDEYPSVESYVRDSRPTVNHGDFRLDNLFFDHGPARPAAMIDWQFVCRANPALDLGWFFGLSLSTESRRKHEEHLIHCYHDKLASMGVNTSFDTCWTDYRVGLLNAFWRLVVIHRILATSARGEELRAEFTRRTSNAVEDHDGEKILDQLDSR
jgi:hypothetical protein